MDKETEKAIQNIGDVAFIIKWSIVGLLLVYFVLIILFIIAPAIFNFFACGNLNPSAYACETNIVPVSGGVVPAGTIYCDLNVFDHDHWYAEYKKFVHGWQEIEAYLEIYPKTKVLWCD